MRAYWGGMLREGATTFWEEYDPEKPREEQLGMYGWKFDKDEFLRRMREAVDVPVINVKEELA